MEKNELTAEAFREALEKRDAPTLRKFVSITRLLIFRSASIRERICKALGTTVHEVRQWDMSFETRRKIEEIIGSRWEHVTPANVPQIPDTLAVASQKRKREARLQKELDAEAAQRAIETFPSFRGEKFTVTMRQKKFTPQYLSFLQSLMNRCENEEQKKAVIRREALDWKHVQKALERIARKVV